MNKDTNPSVPEEETKEDFDARLRRAREQSNGQKPGGNSALPDDGKGKAMRIGTELVAAVAVGGGIGYFIDSWLGTKPWFLIGFLLLGNAAGLWNVFRLTKSQGYRVGFEHDSKTGNNTLERDNKEGN